MRVVFMPAAEADLDDIWLNVALESPQAADRLIDDIRKRTLPLFDFPDSALPGRKSPMECAC